MESMMKKRNLLAILLLSVYPQAFAYQPTAAELHNNSALCSYGYNSNCGYNNGYSSSRVNVIRLPSRYGAVVVGRTKHDAMYFDTHNEHSASIAKNKVLWKCKQTGVHCSIAAEYSDQCVSSAVGMKNKLYNTYFGFGLSPNIANHNVLEKCKTDNAEQCHLFKVAGCSLY